MFLTFDIFDILVFFKNNVIPKILFAFVTDLPHKTFLFVFAASSFFADFHHKPLFCFFADLPSITKGGVAK